MQNAGLDEAQAGIKIVGRNISNIRYADDTTLMAEGEEELKSLLMKRKKAGLKLNIQKMKIQKKKKKKKIQSHHFMANRETVQTVTYFILGGSKITVDGVCSHEIKRHLLLGRKA